MPILYDDRQDPEPGEPRGLAPSTVWRWLSWLAGLRDTLQTACSLVRQKAASAALHREPWALPCTKYRSDQRREALGRAMQLLATGRPSRATLWRKWKRYRDGGFEALIRKPRSDRGQPRKAAALIAKAVELKQEQPLRSEETINQFLRAEFQAALPASTLYRHLKRAGATRLKLGISRRKVRRRWTRDHSNALWLGDFEDGPYVLVGDEARATHLSTFIDCHSRYVVEAR